MKIKKMAVCTGMGLLLAIVAGWGLYHYRYSQFKKIASDTLEEALWLEMERRDTKPVKYVTTLGDKNDRQKVQNAQVSNNKKTQSYKIDERHRYNIGNDGQICSKHSYLLWKKPMNIDTLYYQWQKLMAEDLDIYPPTALRMILHSPQRKQVSYFPNDTAFVLQADSLLSRTVGYVDELEIAVWITSNWYRFLSGWDWLFIFLIFLSCPVFYACCTPLIQCYRRYGVHQEMVEKEVPVAVGDFKTELFILDKQVRFDAKKKLLYDTGTGEQVKLPPLETRTLRIFLDATNYEVDETKLVQLLWPDEEEVDVHRLHSAIGRLRKKLSGISEIKIEKNGAKYYLIFPTDSAH